ncbi:MAG: DUF3027 domain-containing protein [Sulfitobacter sp.]|nr:DUF3027 domain-containing protein [Sulfitobacter sp.]
MSDKPRMYRKDHHRLVLSRWSLRSPTIAGSSQCGICRYWIPLTGTWGADWGACSNPVASHDQSVVFEHFGCVDHEQADKWIQPVEPLSPLT